MTTDPMTTDAVVKSACSYCGVGCGMVLQVATDADGRRRVTKASGDKTHPTNFGRLCTKGATSADLLTAPGRLEQAYVRPVRNGPAEPRPTADTIAETGRRLRAIIDEHGPDSVAVYVSGQMSLEAQYLANKLTKGFIGTNQIESNSRLCMASAGTGYKQSLGSDGPPGSYADFDHAEVFFVIGANMADCHPILFLRMLDRVKAGAKLIVVDPRRTATADRADLFLQVKPGTDLALLNGLLHLLVAADDIDRAFITEFTAGWEQMPAFLDDYPPHVVAELTGVAEADLRTAAAMIGRAGNLMSCWTMGLNQSTHGTWNTNALINLHLATGTICRPGSGPFSLTGQPNAMGGREMGYMGPGLPGQRSVLDADDRAFTEQAWGLAPGTLRTDVGTGTIDMFRRMADGEIKACWIICTNPVASVANRSRVIAGLERCELVIAQDAFLDTETNAYADVLLPAALWAESTYVTVNSERNLTLLEQAVDPVGEALPDWRIITEMARAMGYGEQFGHESAEQVFDELKGFSNPRTGYDLRGVTYSRLRATPVQWPAPPLAPGAQADVVDDGRNPVRYLNDGISQLPVERPDGVRPRLAFATPSGRANFFARPHLDAKELPDDDYPFVLNTGRVQHHWHTLTKTGKVAKLVKLSPGPFIEVHPDDAARLGIAEDDLVEIASRRGRAVLPAVVSDRVQPGGLFAPFHWNDTFGEYLAVNAVTSDAVDPTSFQPEFKVAAVRLTRVGPAPDPVTTQPSTAAPDVLVPGAPEPMPLSGAATAAATASSARWRESALAGIGLTPAPPPAFTTAQAQFLQGLLWARQQDPSPEAPVLPAAAPFDADTRAWVEGWLAGVVGPAQLPAAPEAPEAPRRRVVMLWASQTGNAEDHAARYAGQLRGAGFEVDLVEMDSFDAVRLQSSSVVLLVTSTFGDGESPDDGERFWSDLTGAGVAPLPDVRFAVLAFGDSSYATFCGHGRRLDERLAELGAVRITERGECEPGDSEPADAWFDRVVGWLDQADPPSGPPPAQTTYVGEPTAAVPAAPATNGAAVYSRTSPLVTRLTRNHRLGAPSSTKDVRQFGFATDGDFSYRAGDALSVRPRNAPDAVTAFLLATGLRGDQVVEVPGVGATELTDACLRHLEIVNVSTAVLGFVNERAGDRDLATLLRAGNTLNLQQWLWGKQLVDVLEQYPVTASAQDWASVLRPLQPRQYSISSSPLAHPDEVHLTVSAVRFQYQGRQRNGVCSTFLADRGDDAEVPVFMLPTKHFRPPERADVPMIMIGPGTGVAPFRGFLQERRELGHRGPNWLFFGERNSATDFYYADELTELRDQGVLSELTLAFSRDQREKIYVQDRLREQGARVWSWLADGAHVYVCGDASRMAKDVDKALHDVLCTNAGMSDDAATEYLAGMAKQKRYVRDVY